MDIELLQKALAKNQPLHISATGTSMLPLIRPGDPITVIKTDFSGIRRGDILLLKKNDFAVLHRVHEIRGAMPQEPARVVTRGDAMGVFDSPTAAENVLGKVISCGGGSLSRLRWKVADFFLKRLLLIPSFWQRRVAASRPYRALYGIKKQFLGRESVLSPLLDLPASWIADCGAVHQRVFVKKKLYRFHLLLPETRIVPASEDREDLVPLWNRCISEPLFENAAALRGHLFHHPYSDDPIALLAVRNGRAIGLVLGVHRLPNEEGRRAGSVEAILVDPDFRRKGVGTALFQKMRESFLAAGITRPEIATGGLVFPGLHPADHESAAAFFVRHACGPAVFTDELAFRQQNLRPSDKLARTERECRENGIGFRFLKDGRQRIFEEFLRREMPARIHRFEPFLRAELPARDDEGIIVAEQEGRVLGFYHYVRALTGRGSAYLYRLSHCRKFIEFRPENLYVGSVLYVGKDFRNRGLGGALLHNMTLLAFSEPAKWLIGNALVMNLYAAEGAKKIDRFMHLY